MLCFFFIMNMIVIIVFILDLKVVEVAHDHQIQVMKYVTEDLQLTNSYDTWHGKSKACLTLQRLCDCRSKFVL